MLNHFFKPPTLAPITPALTSRWPLYVGCALALILTFTIYLNTLSLPFFQDDVIHIRWQSTHSLIDPFLTAANLPTYRPLGESLMKLWWIILGRNDPAVLRLQNILLHALNSVLVALLVLRIDRSDRRYVVAGVSATMFSAFPLAYQAVIWINVFFYPLGTFLLLMAALSYSHSRAKGSTHWLLLTWLLCFLAPAEIEWGLMSGAILFGLEMLWWAQRRQSRPWLIGPAIGLLINIGFFVIWKIAPKFDFGAKMAPFTLERVLQMSTYYLQGLIYPTAPLAVPLVGQLGLNDLNAVRLIGFVTLVPILIVLIQRRRALVALAGLVWFGLLIIPTLVSVDFDYAINSPRILYPAIVGAVIFWSALVAELSSIGRWQKLRIAVCTLAFSLMLTQNIAFVTMENRLYHFAEEPVHQLAAAARTTTASDPLLFVNLPSWLAPVWRDYAVGNHGIQFINGYASINDVIFTYNSIDHFSHAVSFNNLESPTPYYVGLFGNKLDWGSLVEQLNQSAEVYLTRYAPNRIQLKLAGRITAVNLGTVSAKFGADLELGAAQVITTGQTTELIVNWRVLQHTDQDLSIFVHLYGPDGKLIAQADGDPLLGLAPFWLWPSGQTLQDHHFLAWPDDATAGVYRLGLGVYDRGSGQRLVATAPDGSHLPDDTVMLATLDRP